jgi:hypothetical protein
MTGEFCLMRGMDEGCLLSLAEMPGGVCLIKVSAEHRVVGISCPIESLINIEIGGSAHLAGPDGLCAIQRDRSSVTCRVITSDRRSRCFEIETPRFDAAVATLAAGLSYATLT